MKINLDELKRTKPPLKSIVFCNNKGGVGKTSLTYHLAWMYADLGLSVLAVDLDPQSNLSAMFLSEERLEELWPEGNHPHTIFGFLRPIIKGTGDIAKPFVERIGDSIGLIVGDMRLSSFEDKLSETWPKCLDRDEAAFRVTTAFYRLIRRAAHSHNADIILIDIGPNLGAINRAVLISTRYVVTPLGPDLFSIQGLRNLGPTLRRWRGEWSNRRTASPKDLNFSLPAGKMKPMGYVVMQHAVRLDRPVQAYAKWMNRIPTEYRAQILNDRLNSPNSPDHDANCLAQLKHYRSLMPMAMEARMPMFALKPADGAIGSHMSAVRKCYEDFKELAQQIAEHCQVDIE
jgi:cellulose biosynthesis protein BcsQ